MRELRTNENKRLLNIEISKMISEIIEKYRNDYLSKEYI